MTNNAHPETVEAITPEYLTGIARLAQRDESVRVTGLRVESEPFLYPKFGDKRFDDIRYTFESAGGGGEASVILRRLPERDAVMTLTGDTAHRELFAFETGLFGQMPGTFHIPYLAVVRDDARRQYWAFVEDVREDMDRLGITEVIPEPRLRQIISHLARFHAQFWEKKDLLSQPWLMRLEAPVDYWYRCVTDILDGMRSPSPDSEYIVRQWPWLPKGVTDLLRSLEPSTRELVIRLFQEPQKLLGLVKDHPRTLCHYDFDNRNLGWREGSKGAQTVVIDWEIVGEGLSSSDIGRLLQYQQPENMDELVGFYLDELERHLGRAIDRDQWLMGYELVSVALWQIVGFLFAAAVMAPEAPVPDEQRAGLRERVYADVAAVEQLARKWLA